MMLSISACLDNCESCYWDTSAKCLMSGCKQGFARKADGKCYGESVSVHSKETFVMYQNVCACIHACVPVCMHASSHLCQCNNSH